MLYIITDCREQCCAKIILPNEMSMISQLHDRCIHVAFVHIHQVLNCLLSFGCVS